MSNSTQAKPERLIDARGPRYTAAITTVVLSAALVTESNLIIGFQFAVFLSAVLFGLRRSLYGFIYRNLIQPRLSGPVPSENEAAPRFAQLVGAPLALATSNPLLSKKIVVGVERISTLLTKSRLDSASTSTYEISL